VKKNKSKILVVEKSDIIRNGLTSVLLNKNNTLLTINHCGSDCDWEQAIIKNLPEVLIIPPTIFEKNKKSFKSFREKYQFLIVALVYSYHHPQILVEFDAQIHLFDDPSTIQTTINSLLNVKESTETTLNNTLSERETEVLKWLTNGYSTKKIAETLNISIHTVNAHRKNIMKKLDIKTVSGLTIYAVLNNVISLKDI